MSKGIDRLIHKADKLDEDKNFYDETMLLNSYNLRTYNCNTFACSLINACNFCLPITFGSFYSGHMELLDKSRETPLKMLLPKNVV